MRIVFILDMSTDDEYPVTNSYIYSQKGSSSNSDHKTGDSENVKIKKYSMRKRVIDKKIQDKKKYEEKRLAAELRTKYATYIDIIPGLKDLPYFDLLLVERLKTVKPIRLQEKTDLSGKRYSLPYKNSVLKSEHALKRSWSSSNISEISSSSSADNSDTDEERIRNPMLQEYTSTVCSKTLKLTLKLKPSPRKRLISSGSEQSDEFLVQSHRKHRKGIRSSARLHPSTTVHQQHRHRRSLFSNRNRSVVVKKCVCCR